MKIITKAILLSITPVLMIGCASDGAPGPRANINSLHSTRGRAESQISAAQERQYQRQRQSEAEELQLSRMKRQDTFSTIRDTMTTARDFIQLLPF